ncbi:endonuclease MutS2 [Ruminococcus sp.]|uniref:endonuclease MutS2 n=1 Tax=Ruminococcus sp. TaxID=41978 RepID=UPI002588DDF0|nr:endonuclease MutS2 [Ruminococcus sp.]MCR5022409.1 endonuclease MutS2 [Ruminococcus sp.]
MGLENINHEILELDKVLEMLSEHCSSKDSRQAALAVRPSDDLYTVRTEVAKTASALNMSIKNGTPAFYSINNVSASLNRAKAGGTLSLGELLEIKKVLGQTNELCRWFDQNEDKNTPLSYLFEQLFPNKSLWQRLETAILDSENLSDDASPELRSIRNKIAKAGLKIRETLDKMIKSPSTQKYLQESIVTMRDGRFVVPVKTEFKGNVGGLVHGTSATGSTLFIEPISVVEANNEVRILQGKEQDEIHRILTDFSKECAMMQPQIESSYDAAVKLDLYFAKANLAAKMRAVDPEISDDGIIVLNKARHPLIDENKVVPINFRSGTDYNVLVITGPNTGGKTVTLKTVGLLPLMTMCGLMIPASDGCKISVYKNILADIGDRQSIQQSLSTFSSHMGKVKDIIDKADHESLVLIDELGSGTDPVEGAALAVSIIERLRQVGATVVTTTHYQEIKMYALDTDGVENASCEFDVDTMRPTYKLVIGSPGKSNAFAISKNLGIDDDIIDYAKSLISEENRRFEHIIDDLEKARISLEENNLLAEKYRKEAESLRNELDEQKQKFMEEKEFELEKARRQASDIVNRVQRESQALVDELDKLRKEKEKTGFTQKAIDARQKQRSTMNKLYLEANPVTQQTDEDYVLPRPLKKGDTVLITDTKRNGIVVTPPDDKGMCFVQTGIMKTKIDVKKLRLVEKQQPAKTSQKQQTKKKRGVSTKGVESRMTRRFSTELDIRGYASDEGIHEMDSFIDNCVMSGISMVTIIHGIGTGVLKNAVRNHLRRHPSVKSYRPGVYGEGEDGVTIIELK